MGQIQMRHKTLAERDGVIEPSARWGTTLLYCHVGGIWEVGHEP